MWGKKKKKQTQYKDTEKPQGQFLVHTMQDDIDHPKNAQPLDTQQGQATKKKDVTMETIRNDAPSPFLTEATEDQESSPFFQKKKQEESHAQEEMSIPSSSDAHMAMSAPAVKEVKIQQPSQTMDSPQQAVPKVSDAPQSPVPQVPVQNMQKDTPVPEGAISFDEDTQKADVDTVESWGTPDFTPQPETPSQAQQPQTHASSPFMTSDEEIFSDNTIHAEKKGTSHGAQRLLFIIIGIVAVLIIIGAAFGWFWFSARSDVTPPKQDSKNVPTDHDIAVDDAGQSDDSTIQEPVDNLPTYSQILPNYITLVDEPTTAESFAQSLQSIDTTIQAEHVTQPTTFLVTNQQQETLTFRDFVKATNISLSEAVIAALGDQFEVYAYYDPQAQATRFGFAVDVYDEDLLRQALINEEDNLYAQVGPLFLTALPLSAEGKPFSDSTYKNNHIRFINFSETEQSIDYAITHQRFVLATSKNTMRVLIDYLFDDNSNV